MRVFTQLLFDETISGTTDTWYTPDAYSNLLGAADVVEFAFQVTNISAGAQVTITIEDSADGRHWHSVTPQPSAPLSANGVTRWVVGLNTTGYPTILSLLRLKAAFTAGTTPQCRLKIYGLGRVA